MDTRLDLKLSEEQELFICKALDVSFRINQG